MSRTNVQCGNQCETSQTSHDHDNSWHILTHFDVGSSAVESSELELWELWALSCWSCSAKSSGTASSEVPGTPSTFDVKNPGRSMEIVVMSKIPPRQVTPFHIYVYIYTFIILLILRPVDPIILKVQHLTLTRHLNSPVGTWPPPDCPVSTTARHSPSSQ